MDVVVDVDVVVVVVVVVVVAVVDNREARRCYDIVRGSALECAAIIDAFDALGISSTGEWTEARELRHRIGSMLTKQQRG